MTPRKAVYGPPPTHTPRLTRLGLALLVVLAVLLSGVGLGVARAQTDPRDEILSLAATIAAPTSTPAPEPTRYVPSGRGARPQVARWADLVAQYDWPADTALAVVACESGGDPDATNSTSSAAGLLQLLGWEWKAREMFGPNASIYDPATNVAVAYWIWSASGGTFASSMGWAASWACWAG